MLPNLMVLGMTKSLMHLSMIYDSILYRGVRKKYSHEPNLTKVELKRESSYEDVLNMAVFY